MDFLVGFIIVEGAEAVVSKTVASPFERVRLLQQTLPANSKVENNKDAFRTVRSTMRYVFREEGAKGFWRGNAIHCLSFYARQAFRFGFQDEIKDIIPQYNIKAYPEVAFIAKTTAELVLAGALVAVIHPLEMCRTRLAADVAISQTISGSGAMNVKNVTHTYKGFVDCLQQVVETGGIRAVYRGFLPATLGMFQFRQGAKLLSDLQRKDSHPWLQKFVDPTSQTGIFIRKAVTMSQALTLMLANLAFVYPLDTIARRMKIDNGELKPVMHSTNPFQAGGDAHIDIATSSDMKLERVYRGMKDHIVSIFRQEGFLGMYRGFLAASIHTSVTYAMMTSFALFVNPHLQSWYIQHRIAQGKQ